MDPLERGDYRQRCGTIDEQHLVLRGDGEVIFRLYVGVNENAVS